MSATIRSGRSASPHRRPRLGEMGKPVGEAEGEVDKSALTADYYAEHGPGILADERVDIEGADAWVAHEPAGLVLAVMPWNFPIWQVMPCAIPSLVAGNGIPLKHAANVTGTGSNRAGAAVGSAAGRAAKKSVLELGGSDAFVVLDDADVETAAAAAVKARFTNSGQSCVCAKRFIVDASLTDAFTAAFVAGVEALPVGDPLARGTRIGPLARSDLRAAIQRQVEESVAAGARLLTGGTPLPGDGYFYRPTVLADTGPGMPAFDEETFGPLAAITVARDDEDAVRLAKATAYGLGLSVWTADRPCRRPRPPGHQRSGLRQRDRGLRPTPAPSVAPNAVATAVNSPPRASANSPTRARTGSPPDQ